jgi:hypothetical protein
MPLHQPILQGPFFPNPPPPNGAASTLAPHPPHHLLRLCQGPQPPLLGTQLMPRTLILKFNMLQSGPIHFPPTQPYYPGTQYHPGTQ